MSQSNKGNRSHLAHSGVASTADGKPAPWERAEKGFLYRDAKGRLAFETDGRTYDGIKSIRMFPFTDPEHWISLCDQATHEIVCIEDLETLPSETRRLIREDLHAREFVPIIEKVMSISVAADPSEWHVKTERGATRFTLNDEDDIHRLNDHRILIIDSHGIRYLIPDIRRMDVSSRRILSHYL